MARIRLWGWAVRPPGPGRGHLGGGAFAVAAGLWGCGGAVSGALLHALFARAVWARPSHAGGGVPRWRAGERRERGWIARVCRVVS